MMKATKKSLTVLLVIAFSVAVMALMACGGSAEGPKIHDSLRIEAEAGSVITEPYDAKGVSKSASTDSPNETSGGRYLTDLKKNSTATWFFEAKAAGKTNLRIALANGKENGAAFNLDAAAAVSVNGKEIKIPKAKIAVAAATLDSWQVIFFKDVDVITGTNKVQFKMISAESLNIDYLDVEKTDALEIAEHRHTFRNDSAKYKPALCGTAGENWQICGTSTCAHEYFAGEIAALDHVYEGWDLFVDDAGEKWVGEYCNYGCGTLNGVRTNVTGKQNLGIVVNTFDMIRQKAEITQRTHETVFTASEAFAGLPGGLNNRHAGDYREAPGNGSDIGHIANVSNPGNYVQFDIYVSKDTTANIALRMSNVFKDGDNMRELYPLGDYIDFKLYNESAPFQAEVVKERTGIVMGADLGDYGTVVMSSDSENPQPCVVRPAPTGYTGTFNAFKFFNQPVADYNTVVANNKTNGTAFNFDYVKFPGKQGEDWYDWKFVLVEDVALEEGLNTIVFRAPAPISSIPNTAGIYFFTNEDVITPDSGLEGTTVESSSYASGTLTTKNSFEDISDTQVNTTAAFKYAAGQMVTGAELVLDITTTESIAKLHEYLGLTLNGERIKIRLSVGAAGGYKLVLPFASLPVGASVIEVVYRKPGVTVTGVAYYTETVIKEAYKAIIENSKMLNTDPEGAVLWDAVFNKYDADTNPTGLQPKMTIGIEEDGVRSIPSQTLEDSDNELKCSGAGFGGGGQTLTFKFATGSNGAVSFAFRMAADNWTQAVGGNTAMTVNDYITILINGISVDLDGLILLAPSTSDYQNWSNIVIEGIDLEAGEHTIVINGKSSKMPKTNLLWAYSDTVEFTKGHASVG